MPLVFIVEVRAEHELDVITQKSRGSMDRMLEIEDGGERGRSDHDAWLALGGTHALTQPARVEALGGRQHARDGAVCDGGEKGFRHEVRARDSIPQREE